MLSYQIYLIWPLDMVSDVIKMSSLLSGLRRRPWSIRSSCVRWRAWTAPSRASTAPCSSWPAPAAAPAAAAQPAPNTAAVVSSTLHWSWRHTTHTLRSTTLHNTAQISTTDFQQVIEGPSRKCASLQTLIDLVFAYRPEGIKKSCHWSLDFLIVIWSWSIENLAKGGSVEHHVKS